MNEARLRTIAQLQDFLKATPEVSFYHITCVDAVSQWQVEACVEGISAAFLLPVLEFILSQFPFVIKEFNSDNGSEYVNKKSCRAAQQIKHRADQITRTSEQR